MAGLRGSQAFLVAAKQASKGSAPAAFTDTYLFEGGNIMPSRGTAQLSETDTTRNAGNFYVTQTAVEGSPEFYGRIENVHHPLEYALGTSANTGSVGEYVHTATPAASLPYITLGKAQGGLLFEQYTDLKVDSLSISAGTASPLIFTMGVQGLSAKRLAAEWTAGLAPPATATSAPYNFNNALVKLGGSETRLIENFQCQINNNLTLQQTDSSVPYDVVEGTFAVTLGFDLIFESLAEYNKFQYGAEAGTTQSESIFTTSFSVLFEVAAKTSLELIFPSIAYQEFPVAPDPSGGPVTVSVRAAAQRNSEGFIKTIAKNAVAT